MYWLINPHHIIHRHTGGLEISMRHRHRVPGIHRHTGGLEICAYYVLKLGTIHRHTGGLEKK